MKYFKAFESGMVCKGKQYAENTVYEETGVDIGEEGMMHFCETPFDTLLYYAPFSQDWGFTEFAEVEPLNDVVRDGDKIACNKIRIGRKLSLKELVEEEINIHSEPSKSRLVSSDKDARFSSSDDDVRMVGSGESSRFISAGDCAQIGSSGDWAYIGCSGGGTQIISAGKKATIGNSGPCAHIVSSGDVALISNSGSWSQIGSSGYWAQISDSGYATYIYCTGDNARVSSSGDQVRIKMLGSRSAASALGDHCAISGKIGDWITLAEWTPKENGLYPTLIRSAQIDGDVLKEDVMYTLKDGEFVEEE